jgi:hypothetical protein
MENKRSSDSIDVRSPRYVAEHIPNANFVEVEINHLPWAEGREALCDEIEGVPHRNPLSP